MASGEMTEEQFTHFLQNCVIPPQAENSARGLDLR